MSFIQRVASVISQKQTDSINKLTQDANTFIFSSQNFFDKLTNKIYSHTASTLSQNFDTIVNYLLSEDLEKDQNMPIREQNISRQSIKTQQIYCQAKENNDEEEERDTSLRCRQQQKIMLETNEGQNFEANKHKQNQLSLSNINHQQKKIELQIQKDTIQEPEMKNVIIHNNTSNKGEKCTIQSMEEVLYDKKRYDRSLSVDEKPNVSFNMDVSHLIGKRDVIVKRQRIQELQIKKMHRNTEKQTKSKKLRTRLVKLQPIARQKYKQMKSQQAKQKISAAMQFLSSLQTRKKCSSYKITEWRQDRSYVNGLNKIDSSPINYNFKKVQNHKNKYELYNSRDNQYEESYNLNTMKKKENKSIINEQKFVLSKPPPYNLYNIHLHKHEVFQLPFK